MKNKEIHTTSAHHGERNITRTRVSGSRPRSSVGLDDNLYQQFRTLTHNDPTFSKEIAMFTPELRDFCSWLESACGVGDASGFRREHATGYMQYLRQNEKNTSDRLYVNAHLFAMELYCTVVYYAKLIPQNYAAASRHSHAL